MSRILKTLASVLAISATAVLYPSTASAAISVVDTLDNAVAPFTPATGRVFRDGVASTCGSAKAFPGTFGVGTSFAYRTTATFYNNAPGCVTITLTPTGACTGAGQAHLIAYSTFNPANLSSTYLGDSGSSSTTTPVSLSIDMTSGPLDIVVMSSSTAAGACTYTLTSAQLNAGAPIPTLTEWAMAGLAGLLMIGGAFFIRRRRMGARI